MHDSRMVAAGQRVKPANAWCMDPNAPGLDQSDRGGIRLQRSPALVSEVPILQEAGVAEYQVNVWFGLLATVGTPPDVVARLNAETVRVLNLPDVRERFRTLGVDVIASSPEQFAQHLKSEIIKWGKVVREAKIRVD